MDPTEDQPGDEMPSTEKNKEVWDVSGYGEDKKNEPSAEDVRQSFSQSHLMIEILRLQKEEDKNKREYEKEMKLKEQEVKFNELENAHELAKSRQAHALGQAKYAMRVAPAIFSGILVMGIMLVILGADKDIKKLGENLAVSMTGLLSGIFIGKGASSNGTGS